MTGHEEKRESQYLGILAGVGILVTQAVLVLNVWIGDAVGHHVHPRVLGLGEVMDYVNVLGASQEIFKKLELFHGKVIDGATITGICPCIYYHRP